jgi:hypothetical protein
MQPARTRFGQSPTTSWQSLVVLVGAAFGPLGTPVLLHIFAETGCACSEYREEVTGVTIQNRLWDTSPERSAAKFLEGLRNGRCTEDETAKEWIS